VRVGAPLFNQLGIYLRSSKIVCHAHRLVSNLKMLNLYILVNQDVLNFVCQHPLLEFIILC
ncbi:MAG: hypothetical protein ACPHPB_06595, partial [Amylibacter sp.]